MTQAHDQQTSIDDLKSWLKGRTDNEITRFFDWTMNLVNNYCAGYELSGPIYLVLDNSLMQDFKHCPGNPERALRALAFSAFCRFVQGWSDRATFLAISPVCLYEHLGRRALLSTWEAGACLSEVRGMLSNTRLEVCSLGHCGNEDLRQVLQAVDEDARFLADFADEIDSRSWRLDFEAEYGAPLALEIAHRFIPDQLPLRYFSPWYVKFVFASRIEHLIVQQSQHNPVDARPIGADGFFVELPKLIKIKKGVLKGLGDIDLLQCCDVQSKVDP